MNLKSNDDEELEKKHTQEAEAPDYVPCEMFLESTGFFSASSNRIKSIFSKEKILKRKNALGQTEEFTVTIKAIHDVGLPATFDQDLYRAFLKICDEVVSPEGVLPQPLKVPTKKLLRYAGKNVSAWYIQEVRNWFVIMGGTHIVGQVYNALSGGYEAIGSGVFDTYVMRGKRTPAGEIAGTNEVYLSEWFLRNYEAKHFRRLDLNFYNSLKKNVSKALLPLLESGWFAASGKSYRKSYRSLCNEFLLQARTYESQIREQLDPAHQELQDAGFLGSWEYKALNDGDFVISWKPGKRWFDEQGQRTTRKKNHRRLSNQDEQIMDNRKAFNKDRVSKNLDRVRRNLGRKMSWQENSGGS
jgi:hypothetical protein